MKKVYIVDDDKDIIEAISIVLESEGYEIGSQTHDKDIVDNTKAFGPDLIILDVMFPEDASAGFTMARELHDCEETRGIPVIMLSAVNEKGTYAGTFSNRDRDDSYLPVTEFIEKPVSIKDLLARVQALTG